MCSDVRCLKQELHETLQEIRVNMQAIVLFHIQKNPVNCMSKVYSFLKGNLAFFNLGPIIAHCQRVSTDSAFCVIDGQISLSVSDNIMKRLPTRSFFKD